MEKYLENDYIMKAMSFYHITETSNILRILGIVQHNHVLQESISYYHQFLFTENTEYYKMIKKYDDDPNNNKELNGLIILTGYFLHLQNMTKRRFDLWQIERQIRVIHSILDSQIVSFDGLQWAARFIRGNVIEVGPLQYEIIYQIPRYFQNYYSKKFIKIHIPSSKKLIIDDVRTSLDEVSSLIEKYYPEIATQEVVYYTDSWLLSPELLQILDEDSNIIQFQRLFHLASIKEDYGSFLKFVINNKERKNTILYKKIKLYLEQGVKLHSGVGILVRDQKSNRRI